MVKTELINQLENAKNTYVLGLAAISLFAEKNAYPILAKNWAQFGKYTLKFDQVTNLLENTESRQIAIEEFLKSHIRALIKECFELIGNYCRETNQTPAFRAVPWYQFARMIRNCLSHNFRFEFRNSDKRKLPVSWKNRTIDSGMDGTYLKLDFFSYVETWELFLEYQQFVENDLQ